MKRVPIVHSHVVISFEVIKKKEKEKFHPQISVYSENVKLPAENIQSQVKLRGCPPLHCGLSLSFCDSGSSIAEFSRQDLRKKSGRSCASGLAIEWFKKLLVFNVWDSGTKPKGGQE